MTRKEIADALSKRMPKIKKSDANRAVKAIADIVTDALVAGEKISIHGFGAFYTTTVKAKPARDIKKGTQMVVPAHKVVKFRLSKNIKSRIIRS